jgi:hypothetical protein
MSRLYASIDADASKTEATRRAHKYVSAHVRGWDNGVEVVGSADPNGPSDCFDIYMTSGSHASGPRVYLGQVVDGRFIPNADAFGQVI